MSSRAFIIAGTQLLPVANPEGAALSYHARACTLVPGQQVPAQRNPRSDTIIAVTEGIVEVMINGAVTALSAGDFVRVAAGLHFAWRNPREQVARVLHRTSRKLCTAHHCWMAHNVTAA